VLRFLQCEARWRREQRDSISTVHGVSDGDSTQLVYLRARYYNPADGRFQSRDTWGGDVNRPMSTNRWGYVEGNPINRVDPTGYSSCSSLGTCGPDVTDWFMQQMKLHYEKGNNIKQERNAMRARASSYVPHVPGLPPILFQIINDPTFMEIASEWTFPYTYIPIGLTPLVEISGYQIGPNVVDALGILEYALYGLAPDYGALKFKNSAVTGYIIPEGHKTTVTLCGHCIDSSDMGNMMFGLGGQARGYPLGGVYPSALTFNVLTSIGAGGLAALNITDSLASVPGYQIASSQAFNSRQTLCQIVNNYRLIGYNENASLVNSLAPNDTSVTANDIKHKGPDYSSLLRWSDRVSTIDLLRGHLSGFGY
jgi:RHS repeat-associated protein